ncbi:hypothetical protein OQA88_556 [Cercophora sp. LCS_1]
MGNHDRLQSPRWAAGLLLMASTASALTLSNFQLITSSGTPIACILAYNSVIPGCSLSDFQRDSTCSAACAAGLASTQETVRAVCDGVNAPGTTVLAQALAGNLVGLLCPSVGTTTSSKQTSTATQTQTQPTTSSTASRTTTATTLSRSTLTSVTSSTASSSSQPPPPRPTVSFVQSQPPVPAPTQPSASSISPPEPTSDIILGGGSPFDAVVVGGSGQLKAGALQAWAIPIAIGLLLLR